MILYIGEIFRYVRIFVSKTNVIAVKNCVRPLSLSVRKAKLFPNQWSSSAVQMSSYVPILRPDCRKGTIAVDLWNIIHLRNHAYSYHEKIKSTFYIDLKVTFLSFQLAIKHNEIYNVNEKFQLIILKKKWLWLLYEKEKKTLKFEQRWKKGSESVLIQSTVAAVSKFKY